MNANPAFTGYDVQRIWREEPCHLIGEYRIAKGRPV